MQQTTMTELDLIHFNATGVWAPRRAATLFDVVARWFSLRR